MITWLLQIAPEGDSSLESIASRISTINFAAIHTSGLVSTLLVELGSEPMISTNSP
jgi:hypothetical protein